ncbi:hypothetical protein AB8O38_04425 [Saccharomonospora xinjiangensis]|uniref:Uncharacterized protein n=1 Tax=Saccharomonospora xinjiangensis XJ-54 TaxID=882086 RepID=I0UYK2_9PSEU|nr:hypothetical protein [Saccharomonospora xinjiangensis]EID52955.1 hypothetical protein SacxiDRAFT_0686 [Saccharomonospora xinjiangensis XJ-54]
MLSRRRIRIALIALIVLALVGWFAQQALGVGDPGPHGGSLPGAEPVPGNGAACVVTGVSHHDGRSNGARETLSVHRSAGTCGEGLPQRVAVEQP